MTLLEYLPLALVSAGAAYVLWRLLARRHRNAGNRAEPDRHGAEAARDGKPLTVRETVTLGVLDYMLTHGPYAAEPERKGEL